MIVIDVGCAAWGGDQSVPYLVEYFAPSVVLGLDPALAGERKYWIGDSYVVEEPFAGWTFDGEIGFTVAGLSGHVDERGSRVRCYDLARMIEKGAATGHEIALKMDAEGSEYEILPHLIARGADKLLKLAWIEWHCRDCGCGGGHREGCDAPEWAQRRMVIESQWDSRAELHQWNR